jgi:hypothetical protein
MGNKLYRGIRVMPGYNAVVYVDDKLLDLIPSKIAVYDYYADAPEWGYFGSGPSQTAAAILYDMTGDAEVARSYHQEFKREFIANFEQDSFVLLEMQIRMWLDSIKKSEEGL